MNARARTIVIVAALAPGLLLSPWSPGSPGVPVALAQDASTAEARKRFQEGVRLFDEKKYDLARTAFLQAYALKKHPDILLNLAQCEVAGGQPLEASRHFRDFLRDPATSTHPKRVEAERGLAEARLKLGRVQVRVDAPDAEVVIDEVRVGVSPLPEAVDVMPGNHLVEARLGARTLTRSVNAPAGHIVPVDLRFGIIKEATPPPPPPPTAAETPPPPPATDTSKPPPPPPPAATTPPPVNDGAAGDGQKPSFFSWAVGTPVGLIGSGLFVAGLGVGGFFGLQARGSKTEAEKLASDIEGRAETAGLGDRKDNPCADPPAAGFASDCDALQKELDSNKSQRTLATVGLAAAGVGLVTLTVGYFLSTPKTEASTTGRVRGAPQPARAQLRLSPVLGPGAAGVGFGGTF
ncbi:MAG TPA: hypothetical protein VFS43_45710 [Polyangiaceae bacterium]|nr:hypothetical protein [Polyangiaceae bacterium]